MVCRGLGGQASTQASHLIPRVDIQGRNEREMPLVVRVVVFNMLHAFLRCRRDGDNDIAFPASCVGSLLVIERLHLGIELLVRRAWELRLAH